VDPAFAAGYRSVRPIELDPVRLDLYRLHLYLVMLVEEPTRGSARRPTRSGTRRCGRW
jgi:hypothetical protein